MNILEEFVSLGRKDKAYTYISKWKLFKLDIMDKNGVWAKIQKKLKQLENEGKIKLNRNRIEILEF